VKLWLLTSHSPDGASAGVGTFGATGRLVHDEPARLALLTGQESGALLLEGDTSGALLMDVLVDRAEVGMIISDGNALQTIDMIEDMAVGQLKFATAGRGSRTEALLARVAQWD